MVQFSFRTQINLWFIGSILSIWLILLFVTGVVVKRIFLEQIDHHLHIVMLETRRIWTEENVQIRNEAIANFVSSQGMVVMVLASDGSSLLQTTSPDVTALTQQQLQTILSTQQKSGVTEDYHFTYNYIRFATTPLIEQATSGIVAVGYSLNLFNAALEKIAWLILGITLVLLFLLLWIGNIITQIALTPITKIIQTAQKIHQSGNLAARVPQRAVDDELGLLIQTLNSMLERLQITFEKEREFFADAAHSLKTPLSVLRVQLENLLNQSSLTKAKLKAKESISQLDISSKLVQDLVMLARIESYDKKMKVNLSNLTEELVHLTSFLADKKNIHYETNIEKNLYILGDKGLLSKALISVIENAILYTPKKGIIKLLLSSKNHNLIVLRIFDTGTGISKKDQKNMWDRFYRGDAGMKSGFGSGLGLAIVKAVVEQHGGTISYSSSKKYSSIFTLHFPSYI